MFGKIKDISKDFFTRKFNITFEVDSIDDAEELFNKDLDITIKKHRKKRSLNANAYCWLCLQKLAVKLQTDKWSLYLKYIKEVGEFVPVTVKETALEMLKSQWREVEEVYRHDGYVDCLCYFGSSTYNTAEMSRLINSIVEDCKAQGIETMTPDDINHLISLWGQK